MSAFFSGSPAINDMAVIIAIITAVEPKSLCKIATIMPIRPSTITRTLSVFLLSASVPVRIRSLKKPASQIISANFISSAAWNDIPPTWIHRYAPLTLSPNKRTATEATPANTIRGTSSFRHNRTGKLLTVAKAAIPSMMAINCLLI